MTQPLSENLRRWRDEHLAAATGHRPSLMIDGSWHSSADLPTVPIVDPSTGETIAHCAAARPAEVDLAVRAAHVASRHWGSLSVEGRAEAVATLREFVARDAERLAALDAIDGGMPLRSARDDVRRTLDQMRDWPGLARALRGETTPLGDGMLHYTSYQPFGVVARIVAFNHPLFFAVTGILAALLAGNAVVLKAAEHAPLSALAFADLAREALPPGVLNVITGGPDAGEAMVTHPLVSRIAFTGSTATGLRIQRAAATGRVRVVSLELGGKNPMLVFPDVDVDAAVVGAIRGMSFRGTQGQSCGSTTRVFVHDSLYGQFLDRLADAIAELHIDVAYAPKVDVGPLVSARQADRVRGLIQAGIDQGARVVTGGVKPPAAAETGGFFVSPTLLADVSMDMRVAREEIFGPVVCVLPWRDCSQVLAEANSLDYGLTASVWTNDLRRALPVADQLRAGYIWVNEAGPHYWGTPFGGYGDSGLGREECLGELLSYLQTKAVHLGTGQIGANGPG